MNPSSRAQSMRLYRCVPSPCIYTRISDNALRCLSVIMQAAIALLTRYGGSPTDATVIFDTFTFNPSWPELQQSKSHFATRAEDDSTLAMRIFKMKHKEYVRQAWSGELYTTPDGSPNPVVCYVSVLEYTPTGLSRCAHRKIFVNTVYRALPSRHAVPQYHVAVS